MPRVTKRVKHMVEMANVKKQRTEERKKQREDSVRLAQESVPHTAEIPQAVTSRPDSPQPSTSADIPHPSTSSQSVQTPPPPKSHVLIREDLLKAVEIKSDISSRAECIIIRKSCPLEIIGNYIVCGNDNFDVKFISDGFETTVKKECQSCKSKDISVPEVP